MQASKPSSSVTKAHFSGPPAMPMAVQPLALAIWPTYWPTEPCRRGDQHGFARFRTADLHQAVPGGLPGDAQERDEMAERAIILRQLDDPPRRVHRIVLPADLAGNDVARRKAVCVRCCHLADAIALHDAAAGHFLAVCGALHPGSVGRVDGDNQGTHQHLAFAGFRYSALAHLVVAFFERARRLLQQQNLAIDAHGCLPSPICRRYGSKPEPHASRRGLPDVKSAPFFQWDCVPLGGARGRCPIPQKREERHERL